ncbi:MAG TPA: hypothetical protein VGB15_15540 [Longimicrobium sp.]|jgi:hypothetical protein
MLLVSVLVLIALAATPWVASHYVGRLPYAPECPYCNAVTGQTAPHGWIDRIFATAAATPVRSCSRCGWAGRMRWRLAQERIRDRR